MYTQVETGKIFIISSWSVAVAYPTPGGVSILHSHDVANSKISYKQDLRGDVTRNVQRDVLIRGGILWAVVFNNENRKPVHRVDRLNSVFGQKQR